MATTNYKLPEIDENADINIAGDVNALASATDAAIKTVDDKAEGAVGITKGITYNDLKNFGFLYKAAQPEEE